MPRKKRTTRRKRAIVRRTPGLPFRMILDQHVFKLKYNVQNLTSNATGNISLAISANNFGGAEDFTSVSALFDQYKVLSCSFRYFPIQTSANSNSLLDIAPLYLCNDYDDVVTPTTTAEMIQYDNVRIKDINRHFNHKMKFSSKATNDSLNRAGWNNLAALTSVGSIKIFSEGLDATTVYGKFILEYIIVVRGRR